DRDDRPSAGVRRPGEQARAAGGELPRTGHLAADAGRDAGRHRHRAGARCAAGRAERPRHGRDPALPVLLPGRLLLRGVRRGVVVVQRARPGVGRQLEPDQHHPGALRAADLRRARRLAGLPRRPLQHRRPGPDGRRLPRRRLHRVHLRPPARPPHAGGAGRGNPRWGAVGRHRRLPQGPDRCPRGDHDDHAQLPRGVHPPLRPRQGGLPARGQRQPPVAPGRRLGDVRQRRRHPPRRPAGVRRSGRRVVAAGAQHDRFRDARGRREPRGVPHGRHERRQGVHAGDGGRGSPRRTGRDDAGPGRPGLDQPDAGRHHRLRRDHGGPPRAGHAARHRPGRAALRRPERGRRGDAGVRGDSQGAGRGAAGTDRAVRGRARTGARTDQAARDRRRLDRHGEGMGRM
ncbi:MAG: ABC transporter, permease protein 1 (cluster 11, riboflavin/purine nucleoside/unknown), partial [uncultured Nocardioides sp.]